MCFYKKPQHRCQLINLTMCTVKSVSDISGDVRASSKRFRLDIKGEGGGEMILSVALKQGI